MKTIPKLIIITTTILLEAIASGDMCMYYISQANKNAELSSFKSKQNKISTAISLLEKSQEYIIKAKYACPPQVKDKLQSILMQSQKDTDSLKKTYKEHNEL